MADRYWVGGSGTWDSTNTTNWSNTSGGAGGFSVPTSADDVYFDAGSNATNYTLTITSGQAVCRNLSLAGPASGTLSLANFTGTMDVHGGLLIAATGVTWGINSATVQFLSTSLGNTINTNGVAMQGSFRFDGVGGEWKLLGDYTNTVVTRVWTLTNGVLDLNGFTVTIGVFSSNNANARTLKFGATGKINLTGNALRILDIRTSTNLTVDGNRLIEATYTGATGTRNINPGNLSETDALTLRVTGGTDIVNNEGASAYHDLDFTGFSGTMNAGSSQTVFGDFTLSPTMTVGASTAPITFDKTSGAQSINTNGLTVGRPMTFRNNGTKVFAGALTQATTRNFTIEGGTVQLKDGVTSVVGSFVADSANPKTLESTTPGVQATLSQASGTVSVENLTIRDINATGGATWNAFVSQGNVDAGNNTGWDFLVQIGRYIYTRRKNKRILP